MAAIALTSGVATAGTVTFNNETARFGGTGFGNVLNLLTLQKDGSQWGGIGWNGTSESETNSPHVKNQSQTQTVATLVANNIAGNNMGLVLNLYQVGNSDPVNLKAFTLRFYAATGSTFFDAVYTPGAPNAPSNALTVAGQGTGQLATSSRSTCLRPRSPASTATPATASACSSSKVMR